MSSFDPDLELLQRLRAETSARPPLTRAQRRLRAAGVAAAVLGMMSLAFLALGGAHLEGRPLHYIAGAAAGWLVCALVSTALLARRPHEGPRPRVAWAALVLPLLLFAWMLGLNFAYPETFASCTGRPGFACMDLNITIGGAVVLAFALLKRDGVVIHRLAFGAGLGAAAGLWSGLIVSLSCECTNPSHIALGHVLPVVLLSAAGALLTFGWVDRRR